MKSEIGTNSAEKALQIRVIDFNVAVSITNGTKLEGATGLKEWSAPETRTQSNHSFVIDCWTLGCIMYLLCTGEQPFRRDERVETRYKFNLLYKLSDYYESETYTSMVDFMSKLMVSDPSKRMTAEEALSHPWLNSSPLSSTSIKDDALE